MFAAFFLGCIATEIRWIGRMRRLRRQFETEMVQAEKVVSADATGAGSHSIQPEVGTEESLLGLQQHLSEKTAASQHPEAAARS